MTQVTEEVVTETVQPVRQYDDIQDTVVRSLLSHASEKPIEHFIKLFSDNKIINENAEKDVEDVIRMYWQLQNVDKNNDYLINPFQQRALKYFHDHPNFIKKLYGCRSNFVSQRKKYTDSVQAIIKFGRYPMFTTEYDVSIDPPILYGSSAWGEISGLVDKQLCIVIANEHTPFVNSMTSVDDKKYVAGISQLFSSLSVASNLKYISSSIRMGMTPMTLLGDYAYVESRGSAPSNNKVADTRGKEGDKYDLIYGDPFGNMKGSTVEEKQRGFDPRTGFSSGRFGAMDTYIGIVSIYGLFETYCFDIEKYRSLLLNYLTNNRLKNDNLQLYNYTWSRFEPFFEKLLRSFVDRAILSAHQSMVDYLISIYEHTFTIPQLFKYFCPGTMVKIKTSFDVIQTAMVMKTGISDKSDGLALHLHVLNPNTTKSDNILVHDIWVNHEVPKSKSDYHVALISAPNRGGTCFRYFSLAQSITLMTDTDVPGQLAYNTGSLKMISKPAQMDMDGNYYWNEWKWGQRSTQNKQYKGRVVVDYTYSRSGWSEFDPEKAAILKTIPEIVDLITLDHYKEHPTYPGIPFKESGGKGDSTLVITPDHIYNDIRVALSLPVMASAFALRDKKWCLVKLNDIKEPVYREDAFEKLVLDEDKKNFIKIMTTYQEKNNFKDLIEGKESGCVFLLNASPGTGKACRNGTLIRIPGGWKPIENLKVGDTVVAQDGTTCHVKGVYPQGKHTLYRVIFQDGRYLDVSGEHLWEVIYYHSSFSRRTKIRNGEHVHTVMNTYDLMSRLRRSKKHANTWIPLIQSEQNADVDLPIDPYLLGVLLGDGHLYKANEEYHDSIYIHSDIDVINRCVERSENQLNLHISEDSRNNAEYFRDARFYLSKSDGQNTYNINIKNQLDNFGLMGTRSWNKFIPEIYLNASHEQRLELLRGLLDTDGYVSKPTDEETFRTAKHRHGIVKCGSIEYSTTSETLAKQVQLLVRSLGGKCSYLSRITKYTDKDGNRIEGRRSYRVKIFTQHPDELFTLKRKQERLAYDYMYGKSWKLKIASIEKLPFKHECTCIAIDHPRSLYVAENYIATHNSLTSEALSEILHKPLYQVTSGELGSTPNDVERAFKDLLDCATRWNAIVQIDEADIYLQERDKRDIRRNAIVSIFLRQLEYFNGTMFLTSNMSDKIDPAFHSRIIQTFHYPELTIESKGKIWKNLLERQGLTITDKQANTLAKYNINGREIKNIIKASISMALASGKELDYLSIINTAEFMKRSAAPYSRMSEISKDDDKKKKELPQMEEEETSSKSKKK